MTPAAAVLLPVRSFRHGKTRLRDAISDRRRHELVRACAERVADAAGRLPVTVMTADAEVAEWAAAKGTETLRDPGADLNASLAAAVASLRERGAGRVIVAHADLPLADDLTWLAEHDGLVLVPDRHADGTNVLALPTDVDFRFRYGRASSHHHDGEALRLGLDASVVRDPLLGWDLDVPEDLAVPEGDELALLQAASARVRGAALAAAHAEPQPAWEAP